MPHSTSQESEPVVIVDHSGGSRLQNRPPVFLPMTPSPESIPKDPFRPAGWPQDAETIHHMLQYKVVGFPV